jgi:hypothetical protein
MKTAECEEVSYAGSTYVWCKGVSSKLGRHPIFVSSPVRFTPTLDGRSTELTCRDATCSLCGKATSYEEKEIDFEDGNLLRTRHTRSSNTTPE